MCFLFKPNSSRTPPTPPHPCPTCQHGQVRAHLVLPARAVAQPLAPGPLGQRAALLDATLIQPAGVEGLVRPQHSAAKNSGNLGGRGGVFGGCLCLCVEGVAGCSQMVLRGRSGHITCDQEQWQPGGKGIPREDPPPPSPPPHTHTYQIKQPPSTLPARAPVAAPTVPTAPPHTPQSCSSPRPYLRQPP